MAEPRAIKTPIEAEIDRGFSHQRWKEAEKTAIPGFNESMKMGDGQRAPSIFRVDYSIIDELLPDDSVFVHWRYGISLTISAANYRAKKNGWFLICRRTYEGDQLGVRIFRIW